MKLANGAGIAYAICMQYTIRRIPKRIDEALRESAKHEGTSLNEAALKALARGLNLDPSKPQFRDLGDLAGTWQEDSELDLALQDQRQIDDELWR